MKGLKWVYGFVCSALPMVLACGVMLCMAEMAMAQAPDLIPATPVPVEDFIDEGITKMGAVVAAAVGGFFVFLIVRKGMGWGRRAF